MKTTTVKRIPFTGKQSDYNEWDAKTLSYLGEIGCDEANKNEDYMTGVLENDTGDEAMKKKKINMTAYNLLIQSTTGVVFQIVQNANGDAFKARNEIRQKYEPDEEQDLVELEAKFIACKMTNPKSDPDIWYNDLEHMNGRIGRINPSFKRSDSQMKAIILANMPEKEYSELRTGLNVLA
ncbi:MAG: hypothetical protein ACRDL7_15055, partial [Gaiellaceae bacterium]